MFPAEKRRFRQDIMFAYTGMFHAPHSFDFHYFCRKSIFMKKLSVLIFLVTAVIGLSCHKKSSNISFSVSGAQDITLAHDTVNAYLPLTVNLLSGPKDSVTIALTGMPAGVSITPAMLSGTAPYTGSFAITTSHVATGTYPITLTATSKSKVVKTYSFNLVITVPADCASSLTGLYSRTSSQHTTTYAENIEEVDQSTVKILNFNGAGAGEDITATISCSTDSIVVAPQSSGPFSFYGKGIGSRSSISLTYYTVQTSTHDTAGPYTANYTR